MFGWRCSDWLMSLSGFPTGLAPESSSRPGEARALVSVVGNAGKDHRLDYHRTFLYALAVIGALLFGAFAFAGTAQASTESEEVLSAYVQSGTNNLSIYDFHAGTNTETSYGVAPGTSPAITMLLDGEYIVAFQGYGTSNLWIYDGTTGTAKETPYTIASGNIPSITALSNGGYAVAFVGPGPNLWVYRSATGTATETPYGVNPGNQPSIAGVYDDDTGNYVVAFQGYGTSNLWIYNSASGTAAELGLGVNPGTSPTIAGGSNGGYEVAFIGYGTANLWIYSSATGTGTELGAGVEPGTSPTITGLIDGSYDVAFVGYGTANLFIYSSSTGGWTETGAGVVPGTDPSIADLEGGGAVSALRGYGTNELWIWDTHANYPYASGFTVASGNNPSIVDPSYGSCRKGQSCWWTISSAATGPLALNVPGCNPNSQNLIVFSVQNQPSACGSKNEIWYTTYWGPDVHNQNLPIYELYARIGGQTVCAAANIAATNNQYKAGTPIIGKPCDPWNSPPALNQEFEYIGGPYWAAMENPNLVMTAAGGMLKGTNVILYGKGNCTLCQDEWFSPGAGYPAWGADVTLTKPKDVDVWPYPQEIKP